MPDETLLRQNTSSSLDRREPGRALDRCVESLIPFHSSKAGSTTRISANKNFLLGGMPAFRETTHPWIRALNMENPNPNQASDKEAEIDLEESISLLEKTQAAALKKLNLIRSAFKSHCEIMERLKMEDDYAEGLLLLVKQGFESGVLLSSIAPMFPDVAKLKAAREALRTAGRIKETKKGTAVVLQYAGDAA